MNILYNIMLNVISLRSTCNIYAGILKCASVRAGPQGPAAAVPRRAQPPFFPDIIMLHIYNNVIYILL